MATTPILGIDFGTTNTAAAWCDQKGKVHLVPVAHKRFILPSIVWYGGGDKVLVGHTAQAQLNDDPENTVLSTKRFIGRRYRSEFVTRHKDIYAYSLVEDDKGFTAAEIKGEAIPLPDVAFQVIKRMLEFASADAGFEFDEAVLTVPAQFSYAQRKAVRLSAEMAGLNVRAMVNEPTAAALYYAKHRDADGKVLVFDLGGGTFDATLLDISRREVRVSASQGDAFLGGQDFDNAIVDHLVDQYKQWRDVDLSQNKVVMQRLRIAAEVAKIKLSTDDQARIRVPFVAETEKGIVDLDYNLNRDELDALTEGLVARCVGIVNETLKAAELDALDVAEIVFVGGQTRMPQIQDRLLRKFRSDPDKHIHPDLGVAVGAAILGRTLTLPRGPALVDVIPVPIGVMLTGVGSVEVIPRNAPVPCTERISIARPSPGKPLMMAVYEAFDEASVDRELLGTLRVEPDWLDANPGDIEIEMRMGHDFDLTVAVLSTEGQSTPLELRPPPRG